MEDIIERAVSIKDYRNAAEAFEALTEQINKAIAEEQVKAGRALTHKPIDFKIIPSEGEGVILATVAWSLDESNKELLSAVGLAISLGIMAGAVKLWEKLKKKEPESDKTQK